MRTCQQDKDTSGCGACPRAQVEAPAGGAGSSPLEGRRMVLFFAVAFLLPIVLCTAGAVLAGLGRGPGEGQLLRLVTALAGLGLGVAVAVSLLSCISRSENTRLNEHRT